MLLHCRGLHPTTIPTPQVWSIYLYYVDQDGLKKLPLLQKAGIKGVSLCRVTGLDFYIDHAGLKLRDSPTHASQVLRLKACKTVPNCTHILKLEAAGIQVHSKVLSILKVLASICRTTIKQINK